MSKSQNLFNKYAPILMGLLVLMLPGIAMAWPGGAEKLYINPSDTNEMWSIYVYGVGDVVKEVLTATKLLISSDDFITFTVVLLLLGLMLTAAKYSVEMDGKKILGFFLGIVFFSYALVGAKVDVIVSDQYNHSGGPQNYVVQDVPAVVGLPVAFITTGIFKLQELFSQALALPNSAIDYEDYSVASKGFNFLGAVIKDSQSIQITNPNVKATFEEYFAQCVMYEQYNGSLVGVDLLSSPDLVTDMEVNNASRYTRFYDETTGAVSMKTCADAYSDLRTILTDPAKVESYIDESMSNYKFSNLGISSTSAIASAYSALGATGSGTNIASQNAVINTVTGAYEHAATMTGTSEMALAINTEQAKKAQTTGWLTAAEVFSDMVIYLLGGLQALVFAMMPLLVAFVAIPGMGMAVVGSVLKIILWLALWPLGLEVVNFLAIHVQINTYASSIVGPAGASFSTSVGMSEATAKMSMVFSLVATLMPMLLYSLVNKGEFSLTEALSKGLGADQGKAAGAGAAKGDVAYDNWKSNSVAAGQYNSAFSLSVGNTGSTVAADAGLGTIDANAKQAMQTKVNGSYMDSQGEKTSSNYASARDVTHAAGNTRTQMDAMVDSEMASRVKRISDSWAEGSTFAESVNSSNIKEKLDQMSDTTQRTVGKSHGVDGGRETRAAEKQVFQQQIGLGIKNLSKFKGAGGKIDMKKVNSDSKLEEGTRKALETASANGTGIAGAAIALATASRAGAAAAAIGSSGASDEEKLARMKQEQQEMAADATEALKEHSGLKTDDKGNLVDAATGEIAVGKDANGNEVVSAKGESFMSKLKSSMNGWIDDFSNKSTAEKLQFGAAVASTALMFTGVGAVLGGAIKLGSVGMKVFSARNSAAMFSAVNKRAKNTKGYEGFKRRMEKRNNKNAPPAKKEVGWISQLKNNFGPDFKAGMTGVTSQERSDSSSISEKEGYSFLFSDGDTSTNSTSDRDSVTKAEQSTKMAARQKQWMESQDFNVTKQKQFTDSFATMQQMMKSFKTGLTVSQENSTTATVGVSARDVEGIKNRANKLANQNVSGPEGNAGTVANQTAGMGGSGPDGDGVVNGGVGQAPELKMGTPQDVNQQKVNAVEGAVTKKQLDKGSEIYAAQEKLNRTGLDSFREETKAGGFAGGVKTALSKIGLNDLSQVTGEKGENEAITRLNEVEFKGLSNGSVVNGSFAMNMGENTVVRVGNGESGYFGTYNPDTQEFTRLENDGQAVMNGYNNLSGRAQSDFVSEAEKIGISQDTLNNASRNNLPLTLDGNLGSGEAAYSRNGMHVVNTGDKMVEAGSGREVTLNANGVASFVEDSGQKKTDKVEVTAGAASLAQQQMDTIAVNLAGGTAQTSTTKKGDDSIEVQGAVVTTTDNRDVESRGDGTYVDQGNGEVGELDHWGGFRPTGEKE